MPSRRVVDSAVDVSAVADSLGIDRFAVTGVSWGGPYSLAVAARLPERVTRAACIAGVAPFGMPGFDWFANMDTVNINELGCVRSPESSRERIEDVPFLRRKRSSPRFGHKWTTRAWHCALTPPPRP